VLRAAAACTARAHESTNPALVLNLGPAWLSAEAYVLFDNNVIEIPFKDWESPPGLGICPLGIIFTVCSSISSWLALNDEHVVVRPAPRRPLPVQRPQPRWRAVAAPTAGPAPSRVWLGQAGSRGRSAHVDADRPRACMVCARRCGGRAA